MKPNVKGMIGTVGKPWGARDSDGDKHINAIDCKPYDKKKQGWIHDLWERRQMKKAGVSDNKVREYQQERKKELAVAKAKSYHEQEERYIKEKAKIRTDKRLKYYKEGGFWGAMGRGLTPPKAVAKKGHRYIYVKRKGGKGYTRKKVKVGTQESPTTQQKPQQRKSVADFKMDFNRPVL